MTGLMPAVAAGGVEVEDPVHVAVVGDAEGRLAVGHRRLHQVLDPGGPVQHRELGVGVQVGERPCGQRAVAFLERSVWRPTPGSPQAVDELQRCHSDDSVAPGAAATVGGSGAVDGGAQR